MTEAKVITVGSETACILPEEAVRRLGVKAGDNLLISCTENGVLLSVSDEELEFRKKMALAEDIMRRYHNTLRELAK